MAVILTNLSNRLYEDSRHRLNRSADRFGIETIRSYDFEELRSTVFFRENRAILEQPTGMGYWLWKPYIILEALREAADGDIVVYADSGMEITASLNPLLELCRNGNPMLLFGNGNSVNGAWTKRDCFVVMGCDQPYYWNAPHCDAAFCVFMRSEASLKFVEEWLDYCRDPRILTDQPNTTGRRDLPDFIEHRRDQSVLSLLAARYRLSLFRMPSQYGNHYKLPAIRVDEEFNCINQFDQRQVSFYAAVPYYNSSYPQLLDHHRGKTGAAPAPKRTIFHIFVRVIRKRYRRWRNARALKNENRL